MRGLDVPFFAFLLPPPKPGRRAGTNPHLQLSSGKKPAGMQTRVGGTDWIFGKGAGLDVLRPPPPADPTPEIRASFVDDPGDV